MRIFVYHYIVLKALHPICNLRIIIILYCAWKLFLKHVWERERVVFVLLEAINKQKSPSSGRNLIERLLLFCIINPIAQLNCVYPDVAFPSQMFSLSFLLLPLKTKRITSHIQCNNISSSKGVKEYKWSFSRLVLFIDSHHVSRTFIRFSAVAPHSQW